MKIKRVIFLIFIIISVINIGSYSQQEADSAGVLQAKPSADRIVTFGIKYWDPLETGGIYYFNVLRADNQVGEVISVDSNTVTIKNQEFKTFKIKLRRLAGVYNIMTNSVFIHTKPHRADIQLNDGTLYTDAKIKRLRRDSLTVKINSAIVSIPLEKIQLIDFDEALPLLSSNPREIVSLIFLWPLLAIYLPFYFNEPGLNTEFDLSKMDVKWKYSMIRCSLAYKYPGSFVEYPPSKF